MAGKTFPGIGDSEDESPPLDPADAADSASSASFYSGPTVVDEAKVEQGLKKLRSLDAPPGPQTGIHRAVADAIADPARLTPKVPTDPASLMAEITVDPSRGTAVGRSVSGPLPGQQTTQPFDDKHLRGTMFGHGVHLPDFEPAARTEEEVPTSKALAIVERGKPTNNEIAIFQPGPYAHYKATPAADAPAPPRSNRFQLRTPIEVEPLQPRKKIVVRIVAAAAGIGLIVVATFLWVRANTEDPNALPKPAPGSPPIVARPPDLHQVVPPPPAPPAPTPTPPPEAIPPEAVAPPAALAPSPTRRKVPAAERVDDEAASAPAREKSAAAPAASAHRTRPARSERHHAGAAEAGAEGTDKPDRGDKADSAEAKPAKTKHPSVDEDPDATMAPSIE
jgi:hypothetical protein